MELGRNYRVLPGFLSCLCRLNGPIEPRVPPAGFYVFICVTVTCGRNVGVER